MALHGAQDPCKDPCKDVGKTEMYTFRDKEGGGRAGGYSVFVPVRGSRQSLSPDAKTEDGTSCLFNKSLLFIQKSTIGFILQILKKWVEGQASHHGALMLINLLSPGGRLRRGRHAADNTRLKPRAQVRSKPPPLLPRSWPPPSSCLASWGRGGGGEGAHMPLQLPATRGRACVPLDSPDSVAGLRWEQGSFGQGFQWAFLQGEAASPGGPGHPQPSYP